MSNFIVYPIMFIHYGFVMKIMARYHIVMAFCIYRMPGYYVYPIIFIQPIVQCSWINNIQSYSYNPLYNVHGLAMKIMARYSFVLANIFCISNHFHNTHHTMLAIMKIMARYLHVLANIFCISNCVRTTHYAIVIYIYGAATSII